MEVAWHDDEIGVSDLKNNGVGETFRQPCEAPTGTATFALATRSAWTGSAPRMKSCPTIDKIGISHLKNNGDWPNFFGSLRCRA
jgi:hypothetical protein